MSSPAPSRDKRRQDFHCLSSSEILEVQTHRLHSFGAKGSGLACGLIEWNRLSLPRNLAALAAFVAAGLSAAGVGIVNR